MSDQLERARQIIAALRGKLAELQAGDEAVAVVGMACRFPGEASNCDAFWRMVEAGRDAVQDIPAGRARDLGGEDLRPAALLADIETFDAAFFDIPPREAVQMDPQQRIFLETAWEALEDAGQTGAGLAGSLTGVFVGVPNHSNGYFELQTADPARFNEYSGSGNSHDIIAGRLAYAFDLRGPAAAINTACSSSLVAVHMACLSLRARDCRMAVVGGVNLILGRAQNLILSQGGMLAPDGRCKTFDARANGYGRGEGCGVVVLKRLSDAHADRDRVLAVIRGSAVNQDGRTNGLTAPNGLAQQALLRRALSRAGLEASRIGYVESHGTGTALGDPIEVEALAAVYGAPSDAASSCALGAAKANINHLEGAAGIAGMIKAILALRERTIPPVAGFEQLNPHVSLVGTRLYVPTRAMPWQSEAPRVAAVSAFGWSGVNAHVVLEESPASPATGPVRPTVIMVSTAGPVALATRAAAIADALDGLPETALESFAWTATTRRSHYEHRLAVAGDTPAGLAAALRRKAAAGPPSQAGKRPLIGFMIGDDDACAARMHVELMEEDDTYGNAAASCAATLAAVMGNAAMPWVTLTVFAVGLAALLGRWGIKPKATAGWGPGDLAARHLAGDMTLAEVAKRALSDAPTPAAGEATTRLAAAGVGLTLRLDSCDVPMGAAADHPVRSRLMHLLAELAEAGVDPTWDEVFAPTAQLVSLPSHPFRRRRHWVVDPTHTEPAPVAGDAPAEWMFETRWQEAAALPPAPLQMSGWLILGGPDGEADRLAAAVRTSGAPARVVRDADLPPLLASLAERRWIVADLRALGLRSGPVGADALRLATAVAALERVVGQAADGRELKLWIATRGAQAVRPGEAPDLAGAPLWGLGRSLALARPRSWGGLIDLDVAAGPDMAALRREIEGADGENEVAIRGGRRYVNRLVRTGSLRPDSLGFRPDASYLVTGAFGGIGPALCHWLARRGARHLVLAGRSLPPPDQEPHCTLRRHLDALGTEFVLERCDVGDPAEVGALFDRIGRSPTPLSGIFHIAAAATGATEEVGAAELTAAFRPKVEGTLALDRHSRAVTLDHFVTFSSAAAILGARGRGHYAAANAFLDAHAAARRAAGLPGLSINWGLWGGRRPTDPEVQFFRRVGLQEMIPDVALDAMARLLSGPAAGLREQRPMIAALDGDRLLSAIELRGRGRFLGALVVAAAAPQSAEGQELIARLRGTPATLRRDMLADLIDAAARAVMELTAEDRLDPDRGFFDLGMDSLMTVALKGRLENLFGTELPSTLTLDYPSVGALAGYFERFVTGSVPGDLPRPPAQPASLPAALARPVPELDDEEVADALTAELAALDLAQLP